MSLGAQTPEHLKGTLFKASPQPGRHSCWMTCLLATGSIFQIVSMLSGLLPWSSVVLMID